MAADGQPPASGVHRRNRGTEDPHPLLYVAETRATRPNGEWGYSTRRQCWATSAQRRCHPEEALYLPTFSHVFDCQ